MKNISTELDKFRAVIAYERTLGRTHQSVFRIVFLIIFVACLLSIYFSHESYTPALLGSALIFFALWLDQVMLYCYHNSYYFKGFDSLIGSGNKNATGISYEVAQTLLRNEADMTAAFLSSDFGKETLLRSGISLVDLTDFIQSDRKFIPASALPLSYARITSLSDVAAYIYMYDYDFNNFLQTRGVKSDNYHESVEFVIGHHNNYKRTKRWWSRDRLSRHSGLGRELSFGTPYELEKCSSPLFYNADFYAQGNLPAHHAQIVNQIENTLARNRAANVLLLGNAGAGAIELLSLIQNRIDTGAGINALAGVDFRLLDTTLLLSSFPDKHSLENELITILNQSANAGNIVIVIENLSSFINQLAERGIVFVEIVDVYLASLTLHIIGIDTPRNYHQHLAQYAAFVKRFEEVTIEGGSLDDTISILKPLVLRQEARHKIIYTYEAIKQVALCAERYITAGTMPERAIDLLHEVSNKAAMEGRTMVEPEIIFTIISDKTGIPVGPIKAEEKDQLLNLENILHEKVVGQSAAVAAIARTMRRARVDIERSDKPIGSFLFLGPTGVGKTETAKALAYTFFGDESKMIRFDMSEFSGDHTLGYLIGDHNGTGMLTDKIHEYPYSVILLDEFEKASPVIHDLFLQILDEGYFTSTHGDKVNARNTIIIATSNAGSDIIRKTSNIRKDNTHLDAEIINHIIENRVFKPELINRFDNTIIFEPLSKEEQGIIAGLMIKDLSDRVSNRGYTLQIAEEVKELITDRGYSHEYGGRGINRVIQDIIEEKIAQKIISGEVGIGGKIILERSDFEREDNKSS